MTEITDNAPAPMTDNAPSEVQSTGFSLSPEYANNPSITKFSKDGSIDFNNMAKSYLSLQSMMGQEKIPVPKGDDDVNAWGMYAKAFGVPDTADGYELSTVDDFDNTTIKQIAHELRLTPKQAQAIQDKYLSDMQAQEEAYHQSKAQEVAQSADLLKKEWGAKYQENVSLANKYLRSVAGNEGEFNRLVGKYGNDTDAIKIFAKAGTSIAEGELGGFEGQVGGFTKTPAQAQAELDKIMNDSTDAFWAGSRNRRNDMAWAKDNRTSWVSEDERKARVEYVNSLMQMAGQG